MTERKYTVAEIDALRGLVRDKCLFGRYKPVHDGGTIWSRGPNDVVAEVEERVRTHMLAGHTAEDLLEAEREEDLKWRLRSELANSSRPTSATSQDQEQGEG